jgi:hypothetical protein
MSDYEKINVRVNEQVLARRREAIKRIISVLAGVLVYICAFIFLKAIGFISALFMGILVAGTICKGAFKVGFIFRDIKF